MIYLFVLLLLIYPLAGFAAFALFVLWNTETPALQVKRGIPLAAIVFLFGIYGEQAGRQVLGSLGITNDLLINISLGPWALLGIYLCFLTPRLIGGTSGEIGRLWRKLVPSSSQSQGLRKDHLRGMTLIDITGDKPPAWVDSEKAAMPVSLGWIPYPSREAETQHTQIEGATGTGKSQAIKGVGQALLERGDIMIAIDGGGDLFKTFGQANAGVMTRFDIMDAASLSKWSPLHEIERPADWDQLAQGLIGDGGGDAAEWRSMAKALFAAIGVGYTEACEEEGRKFSNREFFDLLVSAPDEAIAPFVSGSPAAALIGNSKGLSSVRMSLLDPLRFFRYLPEYADPVSGFSFRAWVTAAMARDEQQRLFVTFKKRDLPIIRNLLSAAIDLMISTAVDEGKSCRPIWLIIDELAGLGEIPALLMGAAELRKTGMRLVVGMQDYDQIEGVYGRYRAASITNNLSNKLILRATSGAAAERLSQTLGEHKVVVHGEGTSKSRKFMGETTRTESVSLSERDERVVMPAEILGLQDLTGYVRMAGEAAIYKTPISITAETRESLSEGVL